MPSWGLRTELPQVQIGCKWLLLAGGAQIGVGSTAKRCCCAPCIMALQYLEARRQRRLAVQKAPVLTGTAPAFLEGKCVHCWANYGDRFELLRRKRRGGVSGRAGQRGFLALRSPVSGAAAHPAVPSAQPFAPKCSSAPKRCINEPRPDTTGSKG